MKKEYIFEQAPIGKAVMSQVLPAIVTAVVMMVYNLADTYFVGMLNDPIQTAAVTLAAPVMLAFNAVSNLFGVGSSGAMSRALGRKERDSAKRCCSFGFYCSLICALLITVLSVTLNEPLLKLIGTDVHTKTATADYMLWTISCGAVPSILNVMLAYSVRAEGEALESAIGIMGGSVLNIILDPVFIMPWGLGMGAAGAGFATFISNTVACIYFLVLVFVKRRTTIVCLDPRKFLPGKAMVKEIFGVGIPSSIQNILNVTGMLIFNNFTAGYGPEAVAAMGIALKIQMVPMYMALGASQGIMPMVGYTYAANLRDRMKKAILCVAQYMLIATAVITALVLVFSGELMALFMDDATVIAHGEKLLTGLVLALPFVCIDFLAVNVFQAIGRGRYALIFAFLRKVIFEIPLIILLNYLFGLYGMPYATMITEIFLAIAAIIMLSRIFKGKEKLAKKA